MKEINIRMNFMTQYYLYKLKIYTSAHFAQEHTQKKTHQTN